MNVSLTPELERFIKEKVASGLYNSASEVVREALRLLDDRDRLYQMRLEELREEIRIGIEQIEQGRVISGEELFRDLRERNRVALGQIR
jgi:antitoxin ParD1/3/4